MTTYIIAIYNHMDDTLTVETVDAIRWEIAIQHPMFYNVFEDFPFSSFTSLKELYIFAADCELTVRIKELPNHE